MAPASCRASFSLAFARKRSRNGGAARPHPIEIFTKSFLLPRLETRTKECKVCESIEAMKTSSMRNESDDERRTARPTRRHALLREVKAVIGRRLRSATSPDSPLESYTLRPERKRTITELVEVRGNSDGGPYWVMTCKSLL